MKRVLLFAITYFLCNWSFAQESNYEPGELLVVLTSNDVVNELSSSVNQGASARIHLRPERLVVKRMNLWLYSFEAPELTDSRVLDLVKRDKHVLIAQFNHNNIELRATSPNDPEYGEQWEHKNDGNNGSVAGVDMDSELAWDISTGGLTADGDTVVVAIVDGGGPVLYPHEDVVAWKNYNEIPDNSVDDDGNGYVDDFDGWNSHSHDDAIATSGHALQVSGVLGGVGNNGKGLAAINWDVQLMYSQALWTSSSGTSIATKEALMAEGYGYIWDQRALYDASNGAKGAFVVATNSSFGVENGDAADYPIWCAMYDSLGKYGILNATAISNYKKNVDQTGDMPTMCPSEYQIRVMCSTSADQIPTGNGEGYGPTTVDLAAPTATMSLKLQTSYGNTPTGSSFSTPHVASAISLLIAGACPMLLEDYKQYPDSFLIVIRDFILDNVDQPAAFSGKNKTDGRLNIGQAMQAMDTYCMTTYVEEKVENGLQVKAVFPNPAYDIVNVNVGNSDMDRVEVTIRDISGRLIQSTTHSQVRRNTNIELEVNDLPDGYYLLDCISNGERYSDKFVKVSH